MLNETFTAKVFFSQTALLDQTAHGTIQDKDAFLKFVNYVFIAHRDSNLK
jgi:hypothetical protein